MPIQYVGSLMALPKTVADVEQDQAFHDKDSPERQMKLDNSVRTKGEISDAVVDALAELTYISKQIEATLDSSGGLDALVFSASGSKGHTVAAIGGFPIVSLTFTSAL